MSKLIRRKYKRPVNNGSHKDIPFQVDLVNLTRVKERTPETKAAYATYHLPVEEEEVGIVAVVMRNQTKGSHGILNLAEKFLSLKEILCKSKVKIGKG